MGLNRFACHKLHVVALLLMPAVTLSACTGLIAAPQQTATPTLDTRRNTASGQASGIGTNRPAPDLMGTGAWFNSEPFTLESRRVEVVLIDFWPCSCVNCIRTIPYRKD